MKWFRSIRWRLQLWYGVILLAVLAGLGITAYQLERGRQFRRIDGELQRRLGALLSPFRPPQLRERGPVNRPQERPMDRLGPRQPRLPEPPFPNEPWNPELPALTEYRLPPQHADLFEEAEHDGHYYAVWARNGRELARSANAPETLEMPSRSPRPLPLPTRMRADFREVFQFTPPGDCVLAGRNIAAELRELRRFAIWLTAAGGGVWLVGLLGGWWLATRAIRPIEDISGTAVRIAAGDLSQRINLEETESELGRLAAVLNSTFARLEAAFAQQQQFTSDAAHELRTPVAVILTQIQSALNRERGAADYRATLDSCQRAAQRMRQLIESLLELARLDSGQDQLKRLPLDLAVTAAECVELVRPLAESRHVTLQTELAAAPCQGDPDRLALVATNLLTNAIHYNREGGNVLVNTANADGAVLLSVADDGPGIAPEHLPHIFERFYRANTARTASQGRSGLGLAICQAVVNAHGGSLEVSSPPGAGAKFTVRLPAG